MLPVHRNDPGLYAGFWRRAAAWFVDALVIAALDVVLTLSFGAWLLVPWAMLGGGHGPAMARLVDIGLQPFGIVVVWLYFAVCETSRWQATVGKLVLGLRVSDECGRRIGFARASGRYFGKFISVFTLGLGFLLAAWTMRKQALHDLMAGCLVLRKGGLASAQDGEISSHESATEAPPIIARPGMPGWAIALIVTGASMFLVVPMLAFLAVVAVPAYQSHALRTQVAQGVALTERARALVAQYIGERGALPENNRVLGLPRPEAIQARYVTSVRVAGGKVVVTYGNQASAAIRGGHVVISPMGNAARLHWRCSSPDIGPDYLPPQCRD